MICDGIYHALYGSPAFKHMQRSFLEFRCKGIRVKLLRESFSGTLTAGESFIVETAWNRTGSQKARNA